MASTLYPNGTAHVNSKICSQYFARQVVDTSPTEACLWPPLTCMTSPLALSSFTTGYTRGEPRRFEKKIKRTSLSEVAHGEFHSRHLAADFVGNGSTTVIRKAARCLWLSFLFLITNIVMSCKMRDKERDRHTTKRGSE